MKGSNGIKSLKLEVLNGVIEKMPMAPNMVFASMFGSANADSDTIKWEIEYSSAGMAPFVAPGAPAPTVGVDGTGQGRATAAYYKEKMFFDEEWLNNMRLPGTHATYQTAERQLSRGMRKLRYRNDRRTEWMFAKMLINNGFTYQTKNRSTFTVNYGIPSTHMYALPNDRNWVDGSNKNIVEDVFDAKNILRVDEAVAPTDVFVTTELLKLLVMDQGIQDLLKKSAFGNGDLFSRPAQVIGELLGVGTLQVYDEFFETKVYPTVPIDGGSTTSFTVNTTQDVEVGAIFRFVDATTDNKWEDKRITDVNYATNTITVDSAPTNDYRPRSDYGIVRNYFLKDNEFFMMSRTSGGEPIAELLKAPFGLNRYWGQFADTKDEWDPEGLWLRVQNKGLPVLYHPGAVVKITTYTL